MILMTHYHLISIHAPVKGATSFLDDDFIHHIISIHAPVKGATSSAGLIACQATISIHAPVKGATPISYNTNIILKYFNPRTREGCDMIMVDDFYMDILISIHAPVKGAT